jgi:WD40 repeat protein
MILAGVSTTAAVRMALAQGERERERYRANIQLAAARIEEGSIDVALETLLDCPERFRHWEWGYLVAQCHREVLTLDEARTNISVRLFVPEWRCGFSADGKRVGTVHPGGIVQVWEQSSGEPVWSFREPVDPEIGLLWLPDWEGVVLARSNVVAVIRMGRPDTRLELEGHTFPVQRLALSADGQRVAAIAADDTVRIWDAVTGEEQAAFSTIPDCQSLFFTPDGERLAVGAREEAAVYGTTSGQELVRMAGAEGKMFGIQPDAKAERYVTVTLTDHFLRYRFCLWTTNGLVRDLGETDHRFNQSVVFSPDGSLLCMSGNVARASVHDVVSGHVVFPIPVKVDSAAFSPDAKRLATRGGSSTISIWEVAERRELLQLKGHTDPVNDMAFNSDGRLLISVDARGTVKLWSVVTGREILDHPSLVWGVSHAPDGRKVATAPIPDGVAIWDTQSGQQLAHLRRLNRLSQCVAFSPDGEHLAAGDLFGDIAIWNAGNGELVHLLKAHDFAVFGGLRYSRDGRLLASAGWDGKVRIWAAASGALLRTFERESMGGWSMDFSPNNRRLAFTDTNLVRIWNVETGQCERELHGHTDEVHAVRFTPDGAQLITTSADATLRLWDVRSGRTLSICKLRGKLAMGLALSPDGRRVALRVCQADGAFSEPPTVEIWDVQSGQQLLVFRGNIEIGWAAEFSPTGRTLVTDWWDFKLRQWEAFPWTEAAFAGPETGTLRERIRAYADRYWQERLRSERIAVDRSPPLMVDLPFDRSTIPARATNVPAGMIDLTAYYTSSLDRCSYLDPIGDDSQIDFRNAPIGLAVLRGTPFDLRGIIQLTLASKDTLWDRFRASVEAIPLNRRCHRLHGLLGSIGRAAEGEPIGAFVLHYADGQKHELEILYGHHVRHWRTDGDPRSDTELAQVAWEGPHGFSLFPDVRLRIFHAAWDNPRPDQEIVSFDFVSKMTTTAAPFLIAVTLE